jgi:hypothetical protein
MTKAKRDPPKGRKPKLTDAERYRRFLDAAKEVGASDDPKDFVAVFDKIVRPRPSKDCS